MRGLQRSLGVGVALGLCASFAAGCRPSEPVGSPLPSVFLISLDTLRKDALGVYRGDSEGASNTPVLDAFARDAIAIDGARTPMPFTLPAHASLFTGVAPRVHGVSRRDRRLSAELGTLPEWLRAAGFETHGVAVNYWLKGSFGFERGFDSYQLVREGLVSSGRVNAALAQILDAAERDRPLFVFAQYFDAHSASSQLTENTQNTLPYFSPPEYREDLSTRWPSWQAEDFCDVTMGCATGFLSGANATDRELTPATVAHVRALYDCSVRHLDAQLGEFFRLLRRRDLYHSALIVVTSDHGEAFREHGRFLHSQTYEETVAIPLLVKLPADMSAPRSGGRAMGLAMLEDVAPTILDVLGLPLPETVQGVSLLPLLLTGEPVREFGLSQDKGRRSRHALISGSHKLIYDFEDATAQLYDLAADPRETRDLSVSQWRLTTALQRQLAARVQENTRLAKRFRASTPEEMLSDEEREALRAIGYLED